MRSRQSCRWSAWRLPAVLRVAAAAAVAIASTAAAGGAVAAEPPPACSAVAPPPGGTGAAAAAATAATAAAAEAAAAAPAIHAAVTAAVTAAIHAAVTAAAATAAGGGGGSSGGGGGGARGGSPPSIRPWASLTSAELAALLHPAAPAPAVVLLPVSSTEQHGRALPLGTDTALVDAILHVALAGAAAADYVNATADASGVPPPAAVTAPAPTPASASASASASAAAAAASALAVPSAPVWLPLPHLAVGAAGEHRSFPGTLSLSDATLAGLYGDVLASVAAAGATRVVVVNGHGGQTANVDMAVRAARFRGAPRGGGGGGGGGDGGGRPPPLVVAVHLQGLLSAAAADMVADGVAGWGAAEAAAGIHGGAIEASVMLAVAGPAVVRRHGPSKRGEAGGGSPDPAAVPPALAPCTPAGLCAVGGVGAYGWRAEDLHPDGAVGDVAAASAEAGVELLRRVGGRLAALLRGVAAADLAELLPGG